MGGEKCSRGQALIVSWRAGTQLHPQRPRKGSVPKCGCPRMLPGQSWPLQPQLVVPPQHGLGHAPKLGSPEPERPRGIQLVPFILKALRPHLERGNRRWCKAALGEIDRKHDEDLMAVGDGVPTLPRHRPHRPASYLLVGDGVRCKLSSKTEGEPGLIFTARLRLLRPP